MMEPQRNFPFRRALTVNPIIIPVLSITTGTATAVDKTAIQAAGVTSFKMYNPTPYWVWYRGWNGAAGAMPVIKEMGHYIPPGGVDLNTSQIPDWIAAVAQAEPGVPAPVAGDNATLVTAGRLIMIYGSGA